MTPTGHLSEPDIRAALGEPGVRDADAVYIGLGFLAPLLMDSAAGHGTALRVRAGDGPAFGDPEAAVGLTGEPFELLRAMTGRRSVAQLREMSWQGDGDAVLPAFTYGPFRPAAERVLE